MNLKVYMDEVVKEMNKVSWPNRKELISNTTITLIATAILSLFIFGADRIIGALLEFIYS